MTTTLLAEHAALGIDHLARRLGVRAGCDVVDVARLRERLARTPGLRERLFTPRELQDATRGGACEGSDVEARRLAARVAAKEAAWKALGRDGLRFRDVEVVSDALGAPHLLVHGRPSDTSVSLSHDTDTAIAVVIATLPDADPAPVDLHQL